MSCNCTKGTKCCDRMPGWAGFIMGAIIMMVLDFLLYVVFPAPTF